MVLDRQLLFGGVVLVFAGFVLSGVIAPVGTGAILAGLVGSLSAVVRLALNIRGELAYLGIGEQASLHSSRHPVEGVGPLPAIRLKSSLGISMMPTVKR